MWSCYLLLLLFLALLTSFLMPARYIGCPGAHTHTHTHLQEFKPSLFMRLQIEAASRGQPAVKSAGEEDASLFARDAGWNTGHVLQAARAEDEQNVRFSSTYCVRLAKYRPSDGVVNYKTARHSLLQPLQESTILGRR